MAGAVLAAQAPRPLDRGSSEIWIPSSEPHRFSEAYMDDIGPGCSGYFVKKRIGCTEIRSRQRKIGSAVPADPSDYRPQDAVTHSQVPWVSGL